MKLNILAFALLSAALGTAKAQTCTAFAANQPVLRQEGVSEPVGDILISCSGTPAAGAQTLSLYVGGASITSRQLYTGAAPASIPTEAALLINDVTTTATQGFLQNGALVFSGFTLPDNAGLNNFQLRLTNLRVNANSVAAGTFITSTVLATFPIQNQANLVMGVVQTSLSITVTNSQGYTGCQSSTTATATLTIAELANTAFKSPAVSAPNSTPGGWYQNGVNTESQTVLSPTPAGWINQLAGVAPGQADHATRFRVNLSNVLPGVTVLLPVNVSSASGAGTLVATSGGDVGAFSAVAGSMIPITSAGSVTYEVRTQSASSIDSFQIPITIDSAANIAPGSILVSATYAGSTAEASTVIPVFADTSVLTPLATYSGCSTIFHLSFSEQTFRGPLGAAIAPVVVQVLDINGNLVTLSTAAITVASTPSGATATVNAANGTATFTNDLIFSAAGTYALSATSNGMGSGTSGPLVIAGQPATTTLVSALNPIVLGRAATLIASVSPSSASGSVTFYDGTTVLGNRPLISGSATLSTILLPSGMRALTAIYTGDATYAPSMSPVLPQVVTPVPDVRFMSPVNYGVGSNARWIATADLNSDGISDVVVANVVDNNVSVLLGNGDGSFRMPVNYTTGGSPFSMAVGDINGDGKPDIVVVNFLSNCDCSNLVALLGNGDGTFQPAVSYAAGSNPVFAALGDFNGDGRIDIVVTGLTSGLSVLLGNGDGTFRPPLPTAANSSYNFIAVGDFNGDGKPDLAVTSSSSSGINAFLGNGDGTFRATTTNFGIGGGPVSVAVGDFNGDGRQDIVVGNGSNTFVYVFLGNGNGTFQNGLSYPSSVSNYVTVADVNGDGFADILASGNGGVNVLTGNGNGTFQSPVGYFNLGGGMVAVGEFNGDGRADIAVANPFMNTVSILLGISPQLKFTVPPNGGAMGAILPSIVVQVQDSNGNVVTGYNPAVTLTSTPAGINATTNALNGIATFNGLFFTAPGSYTLTAASPGLPSATTPSFTISPLTMTGSKVGLIRNNVFNFDSDANAIGPAPNDPADRVDSFTPPGGIQPGDIGVVGDWTGNGQSKAGWFRPATGQWWLDANNDGAFDAGDFAYNGFGGPGDVPVIGDWAGIGKSAIGIVHAGFEWVLDLNADGSFQQPAGNPFAGDAVFAFGNLGDVPVVGNWFGKVSASGFPISQAGAVRTYCTGTPCVTQGGPFLWMLDGGIPGTPANVTPQSGHGMGNSPGIAFGGGAGDIPVSGDWYNIGQVQFGFLRQGFLWVLDAAQPLAPQNNHVAGFTFPYGGLAGDVPIVGKW